VEKDTRKAKEGSRSGQTRRFLRKAPTRNLQDLTEEIREPRPIKLMTEQATVTLEALFLFSIKISKTEIFQARLNSKKKIFQNFTFFNFNIRFSPNRNSLIQFSSRVINKDFVMLSQT